MHTRRLGTLALFALLGCDPGSAPADVDGDGDVAGGKADGLFGVEEGSAEARAILRVANESSFDELDDDVGLDRRAASAIVDAREDGEIATLAELDAVSFVGASAFEKLLDFAVDRGLVGRELKIATFNIRWFGLNGDLNGSIGTETRVESVRRFIDEHLGDRDVLVFQEIVDVELFTTEVMFDRTCTTYEGFTGKHQHVMLCHSPELTFVREDDDTDFALQSLNLGGLRPGLHGKLVDAQGEPVAHVVAVHLKAKEDSTAKRLQQAEILSDRLDTLADRDDGLPVILIGDFNTHRADVTFLPQNDEVLLGEILEAGSRVRRVDQGVTHTYRERDGVGFRLDQAWLSPQIDVEDVHVPGPCNLDFATQGDDIVEYYDTVSDHCPVSLTLSLP
jgi:endonuclease/exonuclease/phosphatase family metal-dependent hydrolase